jgi:hypothetical protein
MVAINLKHRRKNGVAYTGRNHIVGLNDYGLDAGGRADS